MPIISSSNYKPYFPFRNAHLNTIFPALLRNVKGINYQRERIETPDNDFLDLDWSQKGYDKLVIVLHGLEGNADRPYVRGMIKLFNQQGWDGLGMNFRGCSGEMNRQLASYHMGKTEDLECVVQHILNKFESLYREIALIGFSMGGNVILKYLGEQGVKMNPIIKKAVVYSVPCHIESANTEIHKKQNALYLKRFMNKLNEKTAIKAKLFPETIQFDQKNKPKDFYLFDKLYTAPINGFKSNVDYWQRASSFQFLKNISIPTLMINAADDTFLSEACYPKELAEKHPFLFLEIPKYGGHVGFVTFGKNGVFWSEKRALEFISS